MILDDLMITFWVNFPICHWLSPAIRKKTRPFWGWFPLLAMIPRARENSEITIFYPLRLWRSCCNDPHRVNWKAKPSSTGGIGRLPPFFTPLTIEWTLKSIETQHMKKSAQLNCTDNWCAFVCAKNMLLILNMCQLKSAIHTGND